MSNESGIIPVEYKILVRPFEVEEKTEGGIYIPENVRQQEGDAMTEGELIAFGGMAFDRHTSSPWPERVAGLLEVGATVSFSKYLGRVVDGKDGKKYRILQDRDIIAIRSEKHE
jgi:chaperonin GroES